MPIVIFQQSLDRFGYEHAWWVFCAPKARYRVPVCIGEKTVISIQSRHLGVLATASHAVQTQAQFTVYYKPRTSQFIISLDKYIEATNNAFNIGMRFKMPFEGEDSPERRFTGTIVGAEDRLPQWEDSKWRSLKWDESASIIRPERVSPWEIETYIAPAVPADLAPPTATRSKRRRPPMDISNAGEPACSSGSAQLSYTNGGQRS